MQHLMLIFPPKNCQFEVHCTAFTQGFSHLPRAHFVHKVYFHRPQPPPSSLSLRLCKVQIVVDLSMSHLFICLLFGCNLKKTNFKPHVQNFISCFFELMNLLELGKGHYSNCCRVVVVVVVVVASLRHARCLARD